MSQQTQAFVHLQHLQYAAVHALQATKVEDGIVAGHHVQELVCMLMDAVLQASAK
jgi:uncharacterized membrane protein YwzB